MTAVKPEGCGRLRNPTRRIELIGYLEELSDIELQKAMWTKFYEKESGEIQGIDNIYHFFFDDTDLNADPQSEVGNILLSDSEVKTIKDLTSALEFMLTKLHDASSTTYISDRDWSGVVKAARAAWKECTSLKK